MSEQKIPAELFCKIFSHLQKTASKQDIKNVGSAVMGTYLEDTFDYITSRSVPKKSNPANLICPICLFAEPEIYEDSIWEELCHELFSCHFVMYGGSELVEGDFETAEPPQKQRRLWSEDGNGARIFTNQDHTHKLKFVKASEMNDPIRNGHQNSLTDLYVKKILNMQNNEKTLKIICDKLNDETINGHQGLKIYTDVGSYVEHLDECMAFSPPLQENALIQRSCQNSSPCDVCTLNFDSFYRTKSGGVHTDDITSPRRFLQKLYCGSSQAQNRFCIPNLAAVKDPDKKLFDTASQNNSFLHNVTWPILGMAVAFQLEDHLTNPTEQFACVDIKKRRALALRDLLTCFCQVVQEMEFNFQVTTWMKAKFAAFHGMLEILNSFFHKY